MIQKDNIRERYYNDPAFAAIADHAMALIATGTMDALSLAQAVTLGAQMYAERYAAPVVLVLEDRTLHRLERGARR